MSNKSILLVEDDEFLQQLYFELLSNEKFHVTASGDGTEALKLIESKNWDLILLDIMLPGLDGFQIVEKLEKTQKKKLNTIVYLTNLDGNDDDLKKLKKVRKFMIKSDMSPLEFVENVKKLLSK
ncbi:MAG: Two-component system response regulator [Candidatus Roizmanbacteria bacterium GW2011_GWA2_37_7]|uniref:Two-component system response regulator n=1 Tax=Candidatus Roizmanbacteria bacterium GW2011_GWA2_37_7 TaxID=1618481 RepID=A0A0G0JIM8_9BACT|nr:MAG: Two-component system response regulator [Candidatus Roizmanbacteria bacterium GW2011_GWA2_37_7]